MTRLLVVRLGSLGDLVHALPAVAALRRAHPAASIDWLVDAVHADFLALVPAVSSTVQLRNRTLGAWLDARAMLRAARYDAALDLQGLLKSGALARLSGATRVLGFDRRSLREPMAAAFYTERVDVRHTRHIVHKNLALAAALGAATDRVEFPLAPVESGAARDVRAALPGGYVLVNPGAAWPNKRWPPDRLAAVAREIGARHGLSSVVLWGPGEADAANAVVDAAGGAARLAPETNLHDLVALSRGARLMISGDTGPLHIAAAVGVPIVALFGPTDPARNGPWDADDVSLSRYDACACHYKRRCLRGAAGWCLRAITTDAVIEAVAARLARTAREARP